MDDNFSSFLVLFISHEDSGFYFDAVDVINPMIIPDFILMRFFTRSKVILLV